MPSSDVPPSHPRYLSLMAREKIVRGVERGITSLHGLIAHGRGEAFDYLLGEVTHRFAADAVEAGCAMLLTASHPVISVNGNASAWGYQLVSPRIEVAPESAVTVRLPVTIEAGRVCTGILDEQQQNWIVRPLDGAEVHRFQAGANGAFFVVVSNCNGGNAPAIASRFTVAQGQHAVFSDRWYVETLMREFANAPR